MTVHKTKEYVVYFELLAQAIDRKGPDFLGEFVQAVLDHEVVKIAKAMMQREKEPT